jgi:hypothetical protein
MVLPNGKLPPRLLFNPWNEFEIEPRSSEGIYLPPTPTARSIPTVSAGNFWISSSMP